MKNLQKNLCLFISLAVLICLFCTEWNNPYLNQSESKATLKELSFKNGAELPIFSRDSIGVDLYLREHIDHFSLKITNNRYDTTEIINISSIDKNSLHYAVSFFDTGIQKITLTTYRTNGDTFSEQYSVHTYSPLKQNTVEYAVGETVQLKTDSVQDNNVFYFWDFHNGTVIMQSKPTATLEVKSALSSSVGDLYVSDIHHQSPKAIFMIRPKAKSTVNLSFVCDSQSNNTLFTSTSNFTLVSKISGVSGVKSYFVNNQTYDRTSQNIDGSFQFYNDFKNIDSLSPLRVIITIIDNRDILVNDTVYIKYYTKQIQTTPEITLANPSEDSSDANQKELTVRGSVKGISSYPSSVVYFYINENLLDGYAKIQNDSTFYKPINLELGTNKILCKVYADTLRQGNSLVSKEITVVYDPESKDTIPPQILFKRNGNLPLKDAGIDTIHANPLHLRVGISDLSQIAKVTFNNDSIPAGNNGIYTADINIPHKPEMIIIKATDIANNTATDTVNVLLNHKPVISGNFSDIQVVADSVINWKLSLSDSDTDPITVAAILKNNRTDTLLPVINSTISWNPQEEDTGNSIITITAYDGFEKVDTSFSVYVIKHEDSKIPVKWATDQDSIPDTLLYGEDTLNLKLKKAPLSNCAPFTYKVEVVNPYEVLHNNNDSTFSWIPDSKFIGARTLKFTVSDNCGNSDVFSKVITIDSISAKVDFKQPTISVSESNGNATVTVRLSRKVHLPVKAVLSIDNRSTAIKNTDYVLSTPDTITFQPGETEKNIDIAIINDNRYESDKNLLFNLKTISKNLVIGANPTCTLSILDDDNTTYSFSKTNDNGSEMNRTYTVEVNLSKPLTTPVSLTCEYDQSMSTGTTAANFSFMNNSNQITFQPGNTSATVQFQLKRSFFPTPQNATLAFRLVSSSAEAKPGNITVFKFTINPY